jgi:molecular chaperone DnaJ
MPGEGFVDLGDALRAFMRDFGGLGGFGDVFGSAFETASGGGAQRGDDVEVRLDLTLEEVATGVERSITIPHLVACTACAGSGARAGTTPRTCGQCRGSGRVRRVHSALFAQFVNVVPCDRCHGEGRVIEERCTTCKGDGRVRASDTASVRIPPGVTSGTYVALRGLGDAGPRSGPPGDVLLLIEEKPHTLFVREGDDVVLDVCVTFSQAALGASLDVPTLEGSAPLAVPSGIQSGTVLKLKGKGLGRPRGSGRGDQLVRVIVWTPSKPSEKEKAALRDLARVESPPPQPGKSFFSTVRDFFTRDA